MVESFDLDRPHWMPPLYTNTGVYFAEIWEPEMLAEPRRGDLTGQFAGPVKIGWARNVEARIAQLQTGNPSKIRVRTVMLLPADCERLFHQLFEDVRMEGEWFDPSLDENLNRLGGAYTRAQHEAVEWWLRDKSGPETERVERCLVWHPDRGRYLHCTTPELSDLLESPLLAVDDPLWAVIKSECDEAKRIKLAVRSGGVRAC